MRTSLQPYLVRRGTGKICLYRLILIVFIVQKCFHTGVVFVTDHFWEQKKTFRVKDHHIPDCSEWWHQSNCEMAQYIYSVHSQKSPMLCPLYSICTAYVQTNVSILQSEKCRFFSPVTTKLANIYAGQIQAQSILTVFFPPGAS